MKWMNTRVGRLLGYFGLLLWVVLTLFVYLILNESWVFNHRITRPLHSQIEKWFTNKVINQE